MLCKYVVNCIPVVLLVFPWVCDGAKRTERSSLTWLTEKVTHRPARLENDSLKQLCKTDMDSINAHLDVICVPRRINTRAHTAVRLYIQDTLRALGYEVDIHSFKTRTPRGKKSFSNIVARKNPNASRFLTLACHYDSKDCSTAPNLCASRGTFDFEAATDSAVPCAIMLEIAEQLQPYWNSSGDCLDDVSLQLLFFDGEEALVQWGRQRDNEGNSFYDAIYGASALAQKWGEQRVEDEDGVWRGVTELDRIDVLVLLDLIGTTDTHFVDLSVNDHSLYKDLPEIESRFQEMNCLKDLGREHIFSPRLSNGAIQDDHIPFIERGVNTVHLISTPFPRVWHREEDKRANLDMDTIYNTAAVVRAFTAQYLHMSVPPSANSLFTANG